METKKNGTGSCVRKETLQPILWSHNNSTIKGNEELGSGVIETFSSISTSLKKKSWVDILYQMCWDNSPNRKHLKMVCNILKITFFCLNHRWGGGKIIIKEIELVNKHVFMKKSPSSEGSQGKSTKHLNNG